MIKRGRVLVISHNSLSLHSNNGKTLHSIFSGWDSSNLAQLYFQEEIPESTRFNNFFRIRDLDVIKRVIKLGFGNHCGTRVVSEQRVHLHYNNLSSLKNILVSVFRKLNAPKLLFRNIIYGTNLWKSNDLEQWLSDFQPNSVFFMGGNYTFSFLIARYIARTRNIPLDIYITDDYILNPSPDNGFERWLQNSLLREYHKTFSLARNVFVIGEDMALAFAAEFNRKFVPIMNSVEIPECLPNRRQLNSFNSYISFVYAGGLHLGRDISLVNFGEVLSRVSAKIGLELRLTIFSFQKPSPALSRELEHVGVIFGGALDQSTLSEKLAQADFVLHVESFAEKYANLTKLSVSTKIPEYLVSGACLVAYGPLDIASMRLIRNNNLGVCFDRNENNELAENQLVHVIKNQEVREAYVLRGLEFARKKFDSRVTRSLVENLLGVKGKNV
jgi:hypothetical protein